jgi:N-acetylneuraminic acid mutarotase
MPVGRSHMAKAVVGTKIYLFGGRSSVDETRGSTNALSYDASTNEWTTLENTEKRYGMCSATDGQRIWVFG